MTLNKEVSADITQNAFMKLYEKYHLINDKDSVAAYLFRTARNDVFKYYRNRKVVNSVTIPIQEDYAIKDDFDIREKIELDEIHDLVMKILNEIPSEQKETYILREFGGLNYCEIAVLTDVEEKTVKSRLFETRRKLINKLKKII